MSERQTAKARRLAIIKLARDEHGSNELELDDNAKLSEGDDNGCFVQAWVWVSFADTPYDKDEVQS